jgi:hypothetical protein
LVGKAAGHGHGGVFFVLETGKVRKNMPCCPILAGENFASPISKSVLCLGHPAKNKTLLMELPKPETQNQAPAWLDDLQKNSWEPEVIISGIALAFIFAFPAQLLAIGLQNFRPQLFCHLPDFSWHRPCHRSLGRCR